MPTEFDREYAAAKALLSSASTDAPTDLSAPVMLGYRAILLGIGAVHALLAIAESLSQVAAGLNNLDR